MHNFGLAYIATAREQLYTRVIHCNKPNNTAAFLTYPHKLSTVLCTFLHTCAQVTIVDNSLSWITRHCAHLITVDIFIRHTPTRRTTISTSPLSAHTLMPGTACSAIPGINRLFLQPYQAISVQGAETHPPVRIGHIAQQNQRNDQHHHGPTVHLHAPFQAFTAPRRHTTHQQPCEYSTHYKAADMRLPRHATDHERQGEVHRHPDQHGADIGADTAIYHQQ